MTTEMLDTDEIQNQTQAIAKLMTNSQYGKSPNQSVIDLLMAEKAELEQFFATHIGLPPTVALAIQEAALQRHMWARDLRKSMEVNGK